MLSGGYNRRSLLWNRLRTRSCKNEEAAFRKQPSSGVRRKRYSQNTQQIYRRTLMPKCDFNKVLCNFIEITLWHGCAPVNLLHIFRTHLLLKFRYTYVLATSFGKAHKMWQLSAATTFLCDSLFLFYLSKGKYDIKCEIWKYWKIFTILHSASGDN